MKLFFSLFFVVQIATISFAVELRILPHKVLYDNRTFFRNQADNRYSIWTDNPAKALGLLKEFNPTAPDFKLPDGDILAVFINDRIEEDLTAVVFNEAAQETFGDYVSSGIKFRLKGPPSGQKYSHVTAVVFTPIIRPSHLGLRSMVTGGLSEKR